MNGAKDAVLFRDTGPLARAPELGQHVSFVVPAFNEALNIESCLTSVRDFWPFATRPEVVVVDNGSTDGTADIARRLGARVVVSDANTISGVRNQGVNAANGSILIFLDGDCELTAQWGLAAPSALERVALDPNLLTGAHPVPPPDSEPLLWRYWFQPLAAEAPTSHIGSAHMICSRKLFDRLGGFSEQLQTGEDFDLCVRTLKGGGLVVNDKSLSVVHRGYPTELRAFYRRERWHGRGDARELATIATSRVAMVSLLYALLALGGAGALMLADVRTAAPLFASALAIAALTSLWRFRRSSLGSMAMGALLSNLYLLARAHAIFDRITRRTRS
jgi:GT2 family glycosyltransferase